MGSSVVVEQVLTDDHDEDGDGDGDEYDDYHHHYHDNHQQQKVTRHDAGVYVCNAENGVGKPASAQISLQVLCELIIMMIAVKMIMTTKENSLDLSRSTLMMIMIMVMTTMKAMTAIKENELKSFQILRRLKSSRVG